MNALSSKYIIRLIDKNVAKSIIIKNHYSHKWSSCRYALGLFNTELKPDSLFEPGRLVGVAIYGFPVGRQTVKSITPNLNKKDVLELTRLWVADSEKKNTESYFIGQTFLWLKKHSSTKVLVSYSDPLFNHLGIIYQATNWIYQGNNTMLVKGYLHKIHGEVVHARKLITVYGTIKENVLKTFDPEYQRIEMNKKHRYIYILHKRDRKKIMASLKHPAQPYPKNNMNTKW